MKANKCQYDEWQIVILVLCHVAHFVCLKHREPRNIFYTSSKIFFACGSHIKSSPIFFLKTCGRRCLHIKNFAGLRRLQSASNLQRARMCDLMPAYVCFWTWPTDIRSSESKSGHKLCSNADIRCPGHGTRISSERTKNYKNLRKCLLYSKQLSGIKLRGGRVMCHI